MTTSNNDVYLDVIANEQNILEVIAATGNIIEIVNTEKILASDISVGNIHINQIDGGTP